jgi:hypothetical protein
MNLFLLLVYLLIVTSSLSNHHVLPFHHLPRQLSHQHTLLICFEQAKSEGCFHQLVLIFEDAGVNYGPMGQVGLHRIRKMELFRPRIIQPHVLLLLPHRQAHYQLPLLFQLTCFHVGQNVQAEAFATFIIGIYHST